jgi:hypothetical protein
MINGRLILKEAGGWACEVFSLGEPIWCSEFHLRGWEEELATGKLQLKFTWFKAHMDLGLPASQVKMLLKSYCVLPQRQQPVAPQIRCQPGLPQHSHSQQDS